MISGTSKSVKCQELLVKWERGARLMHIAHHIAAAERDMYGRRLGIAVVVLSAIVSSGIFAGMKDTTGIDMKYWLGALSLLSVTLTSINNFLKYPELAEKHRVAAASYGELRNEVQLLLACGKGECTSCSKRCDEINGIKKMWVANESKHIALPKKNHDIALRRVSSESGGN